MDFSAPPLGTKTEWSMPKGGGQLFRFLLLAFLCWTDEDEGTCGASDDNAITIMMMNPLWVLTAYGALLQRIRFWQSPMPHSILRRRDLPGLFLSGRRAARFRI